ncbi:MAG: hypothetical protein IKZ38_01635 [Clostridia bacterium]|nr:hypothetical protein [Clostridia bacterium]
MKLFRKSIAVLCCFLALFSFNVFSGCGNSQEKMLAKIEEFHVAVTTSQECLDELADDIYTNWYNAIYKNYYGGDINKAYAYAVIDNEENINIVETNDSTIKSLYKDIRDCELSFEIKAVMNAYSDYYEFVMNASGSFESYRQGKENYKKELASALRDLSNEI